MRRMLDIIIAASIAIGLWLALIWLTGAPSFILPSPLKVATTLVSSWDLIAENAVITIIEILSGLFLGAVLGFGTAIQLTRSVWMRRYFLPILVFSQAVPVFALAPILTLWFGYGIASKIIMTILIIYFPIASAFHDGLNNPPIGALDLAQSMNAKETQIMWRIRVPNALPALGSGLRLAAVYAPIGAIIGEWVGASKGLGYLMLLANGRAKIDLMFAALFVLALFTIALHWAVSIFARKLEIFAQGRR